MGSEVVPRLLAFLLLFVSSAALAVADVAINGVRLWSAPDNTRLVFDTSASARHQVFTLHGPERLVLDISKAVLTSSAKAGLPAGGLVQSIRSATRDNSDLRIVIDLSQPVKVKSFVLKPNAQYGHRLVIDLEPRQVSTRLPAKPVQTAFIAAPRERVIAIDAGHGGEDPGAKGKRGTREKDVVLKISRKLAALINRQPGMRAVLTRNGDYFLPLRKRMHKARAANAELFISIHADAFHDRRARGSSVFVLSRRGATSEMARWLAARENASDLVGGVSLDDKDPVLKEVLLDLAQTATLQSSVDAANAVFREIRQLGKTHKRRVQKAGFMVLKSPDIPSMLVETAFISNPAEEKRLRSPQHQQKIAQAILRGIQAYFRATPLPEAVRMASVSTLKYKVKPGDTLGGIARQYGVSLKSLRVANKLKGDRLLVGKQLKIPGLNPERAKTGQQLAQRTAQKYRVKKGDTLGEIAQRFGVSLKQLRAANAIKGNRLLVGKSLLIPGDKVPGLQTHGVVARAKPGKYRVKPGDTLGQIAQRHGTSLKAIRAANHISGNRLLAGKILKIPATTTTSPAPVKLAVASQRKHKVKNGETLSHIAVRYGVTQRAIRSANKIHGDRLLIGKTLTIPAQDS